MQIHFLKMKQKKISSHSLFICLSILFFASCSNDQKVNKKQLGKDKNAVSSVLFDLDSLNNSPFVAERINSIKEALKQPRPVLLCKDSLDQNQSLAQLIALNDSAFIQFLRDPYSHEPYRNEIFGVYPARQSDMTTVKVPFNLASCYRIEMYNYALNNTSIALVDIQQQKTLSSYYLRNTQPDIPVSLRTLAVKIAVESPEVQKALGIKPEEKDALMASTKTSLNRSRCERSRHLCVAPTFVKDDKALWAIVDLTDYKLVGIRWTNVGTAGPAAPMITERRLQDDKITSCYCEVEQKLEKNNWNMKYMLTSSDGLRISDVSFNGKPVIRSAKLVDWHVSYSGTDGFGYSDAVGCPYFSQSAVVAWEIPKVAELKDDNNNTIGFVLEQTFRSEGWPTPCNYNYRQRFEFYNDGKFRVACASIGRGCGNTGTYRPVFRIAFAGEQNNFYQWNNNTWAEKQTEFWNEQNSLSQYTPEHYLYKISSAQTGYYIEPGQGQFRDGGRGDFSYLYVTKNIPGREEGENDLPTIGPCCNTDYHQGPEKFIEPMPDNIQNSSLVIWYVAQLRNDDRKGNEYCWAENVLENGVWKTKVYPCFAGPMFVPVK
jgi:Copper amine oxidase, enzyme domain